MKIISDKRLKDVKIYKPTIFKDLRGEKSIIYVSNSLNEIEQAHDRILVFDNGKILMDGHLDTLLESTIEYHQFQIEFELLTDDLYKQLTFQRYPR